MPEKSKNSQTPGEGANLDEPQPTVVQDWGDPDAGKEPRTRPARLAYETDPTFFRIVGWMLGLAILLSLAGSILLAACGEDVPEALVAIGSAAVGALAGVLASRR